MTRNPICLRKVVRDVVIDSIFAYSTQSAYLDWIPDTSECARLSGSGCTSAWQPTVHNVG